MFALGTDPHAGARRALQVSPSARATAGVRFARGLPPCPSAPVKGRGSAREPPSQATDMGCHRTENSIRKQEAASWVGRRAAPVDVLDVASKTRNPPASPTAPQSGL